MSSDAASDATLCTLLDGLAVNDAAAQLTFSSENGTTTSLPYAELAELSQRTAGRLAAAGVGAGDRVLVHLPNCPETVCLWLGLARLGAIFVPTNAAFTAREIGFVDSHATASLAVARPESAELLADAGIDRERTLLLDGLAELLAAEPLLDAPAPGPEDPLELVFTSGTTSAPKAAIITHANCLFSGRQKAEAMRLEPSDRLLSSLPIVHVNAQSALLAALWAASSFVLLERYSASRYCEQLAAHRATVTSLVGTQVRTLLRQEPRASDNAHAVRRAWFALNVSATERAAFEERFAIRLYNGYGLTEAFTSVTQAPLDGPDHWPSVGRALPGRELTIQDENGVAVPPGTTGEIVVGGVPGRSLMAGYWRDPEATARTIRDGWLHTGDLGALDADGFLTFVERKAHTIKRAGENIAAGEVETVLLEHPDVVEAAVIGVPDSIRDEAVKAIVVLATGTATTTDDLSAHCCERLAAFKVPTVWLVRDALPRTALGKVEYRRLREQADEIVEAAR